MGCWNGTCGLTNLPILAGDPVVCYIVGVKSGYASFNSAVSVYPNDISCPISLRIHGEYDDYGSVDSIQEDKITDVTRKVFDISNLEEFCHNIERGEIGDEKRENRYGLWMARKGAYDALISSKNHEYFVEEYLSAIKYAKIKGEKYSDDPDLALFVHDGYIERALRKIRESTGGFERPCNAVQIQIGSFCGSNHGSIHNMKKYISESSEGQLRPILMAMCEKSSIERTIQSLRKTWFCGSGAGSQAVLYDLHYKYSQIFDNEIDQIKERAYLECEYDSDDDMSKESSWESPEELPNIIEDE